MSSYADGATVGRAGTLRPGVRGVWRSMTVRCKASGRDQNLYTVSDEGVGAIRFKSSIGESIALF
jgi:hypothetical protein